MSAGPADLPSDLSALIDLHTALPPKTVRWRTVQGRTFLLALDACVTSYGARTVARVLGIAPATVYQLLRRTIYAHPLPYPREDELRELRRAWRRVEACARRGDPVRRTSRDYLGVHTALDALTGRYEVHVIATAIGIAPNRLARFTAPPLPAPPAIAAALQRYGTKPPQ